MNIEHVEQNIRDLVSDVDPETFVYDLLRAYDLPKASITRLKKGDYNQSKNDGELLWKKKLCFRHESDDDLHSCIDRLTTDAAVIRHSPRFIVVTDFDTLLAIDTKTDDTIDTPIGDLADHFDFFLPWAGMEKSQLQAENPADIKAAEKMGRLYELILVDNPADTQEARHALNIFLSRLLFCFFAEDTDIFTSNQFTNGVASHTATDGRDLQSYLQRLFAVLSTEDRESLPEYLRKFPYVNGGLFCDEYPVPVFNTRSRALIVECGSLNWKAINPDIFGSMIQAVVHTEERGRMGMHYTSVVNIMKVIEPLFLSELREQLEQAGTNKTKLKALSNRLYKLRIFDPACGSGNFLIIAYKEICRLEIEVFRRLGKSDDGVQMELFRSNLQLTQFYGIELDDFAHETAKLSLWLAEHQMNLEFKQVFGATRPTLPLQDGGHIVCGNATRLSWEEVCPKDEETEIFIFGNPPYLGASIQSKNQKADMALVFEGQASYKKQDYIACWFLLAAKFCRASDCFAFVTTNSLCQGGQVEVTWPHIFELGFEIFFAIKNFPWSNNAKGNAGVVCSIVGLRLKTAHGEKFIVENGAKHAAGNINAYLVDGSSLIVTKRSRPLSKLPRMISGNKPLDGGHLVLSTQEKDELIAECPNASNFVRRFIGSSEFIRGNERWCLWIDDNDVEAALEIRQIADRVARVKEWRLKGGNNARNKANSPHRFEFANVATRSQLIAPAVSSIRRQYIPMGFLGLDTIISNLAQAILDPEPFVLAVLSSQIHLIWVKITSGRMKSDYRYSSFFSYNTFPFPNISDRQKSELEKHVFNVLDQREAFPERTLAELYDPDKMPSPLREAHHDMDLAVERCYRKKLFTSGEERLEYLFKLYRKMIEDEEKADA